MRIFRYEGKFLLTNSTRVVVVALRTNHAFPNPTDHTARYEDVLRHSDLDLYWRKALGRI